MASIVNRRPGSGSSDATVELHEEVGPARTSVAEIARRASVTRLTVDNHFPQGGELWAPARASSSPAHGADPRRRGRPAARRPRRAVGESGQVHAVVALDLDFWTWQPLKREAWTRGDRGSHGRSRRGHGRTIPAPHEATARRVTGGLVDCVLAFAPDVVEGG